MCTKKIIQSYFFLKIISTCLFYSVANPGCWSRIPDPNFFIPDPVSRAWICICIKEFKYFNHKNCFLSSRQYDPECSFRILVPGLRFFSITDPGVKKHRIPDPESRIQTRNTAVIFKKDFKGNWFKFFVSLRGRRSWFSELTELNTKLYLCDLLGFCDIFRF